MQRASVVFNIFSFEAGVTECDLGSGGTERESVERCVCPFGVDDLVECCFAGRGKTKIIQMEHYL